MTITSTHEKARIIHESAVTYMQKAKLNLAARGLQLRLGGCII